MPKFFKKSDASNDYINPKEMEKNLNKNYMMYLNYSDKIEK